MAAYLRLEAGARRVVRGLSLQDRPQGDHRADVRRQSAGDRRVRAEPPAVSGQSGAGPDGPAEAEDFTTRGFGNIFYFVFPNTLILVQPDHAQVTRVEPAGVGASVLHDVALVPEVPATPKALHHWQRNIDIYRAALGEDYVLAESTQSTLTTGANDTLIFGGFEFAAARFHDQLEAELAAMASG
ncbi:SRPBCC family protein [Tistrella bauzanensis]